MSNSKYGNKYNDDFWNKKLAEEGYKFISNNKKIGDSKILIESICPNGNNFSFTSYQFLHDNKRCDCPVCNKKFLWTDKRIGMLCNHFDLEYIGRNKKLITIKCKNGNITTPELGNFVNNPKCGCEDCGGTIKWTDERIKQEIEPYGYTFISKERDKNGKLKRFYNTLCPSDNPYKLNIHKFIKGRRCTCEDCTGRIAWTDERIKLELLNHDLEYISHEITRLYDKNVTFKCKNGSISTATVHNLVARNWECSCEKCTGKIVFTKERIIKELQDVSYAYINHYYDDKNHLRVECECEHGHYYNCNFWNFVHENVRCGQCNVKSHGETQIYNDFTSFGIKFIHEDIFEGCVYKDYLPFDFVVYDKDCNVVCAIEYDWKQHYEPVRFGSQTQEEAEECFKNQQLRDKIKTDYCSDNNIPLVRVSYEIPLKEVYEYIKTTLLSEFNINIEDYHNTVMSPVKLITFKSKAKHGITPKYSEVDLENNFMNIIDTLGRVPSYTEFKKYTSISLTTYNNRLNFKGKVYDNVVKKYVSESEFIEYYKSKQNHKSEIGKITGSLSRKYSDEEIETEFTKTFDEYISENGKCPSKRTFNTISSFDDSFYRKRMGRISWTDVCKNYGYDISGNITSKQKSV